MSPQSPRLLGSYLPQDSPGNIVAGLNHAVRRNPGFDVYGLIVGDAEFKSPGWEAYLEAEVARMPNGIGVVSAAHTAGTFVNFPFVTREWVDAVGWYACPDTVHFCWDSVIECLGEATHIAYATPAEMFIAHESVRNERLFTVFTADALKFLGWFVNRRREIVSLLRAAQSCVAAV